MLAVLTTAGPASSQSVGPMTEARVRALARQAQRESRGDATELVLALDRHVREAWGEFESFPLSVVRREELLVTLSMPYLSFRRSVVDVLTTRRRLDAASWVPTAVVSVTPARLESPDIETVQLTRDGQDVAPARSGLRPMSFTNGAGDQRTLHAGDVHFPAAAFAPGAHVTLTLTVRDAAPIVYTLEGAELATLK